MIESNLSKNSDFEWLQKMAKAGYELILYFFCTDDVNIHIKRVQQRVLEGGHDIPIEIIRHRYAMALTYLKIKLHLFKEIYFIDNSSDGAIIKGVIVDNTLTEYFKVSPAWLSSVLSLHKLLKRN